MSNIISEFEVGANPDGIVPIILNDGPPVPSPIKPSDFDGAHPEPWTSDDNLSMPPTNRVHDFNTPFAKEYIPQKASISGMV
ncbi:hypothetical protein UFOVP115_115 [uncultured Caudovirales phage]|uniref:Uncharacterized protein n=1 Tax=uncultured Caudovirales phage TaxID=2100421 RepID=A0A6J5LA44_9CAUD|nr:hypothetical protein UFOVP115_115 [uncultured Caudovirales phage]